MIATIVIGTGTGDMPANMHRHLPDDCIIIVDMGTNDTRIVDEIDDFIKQMVREPLDLRINTIAFDYLEEKHASKIGWYRPLKVGSVCKRSSKKQKTFTRARMRPEHKYYWRIKKQKR